MSNVTILARPYAKAAFELANAKLTQAFADVSSRSLRANSDTFLQLAQQNLETQQEKAKRDLSEREKAVEDLVKPIRDALAASQKQIAELEKAPITHQRSRDAQLSKLRKMKAERRKQLESILHPLIRARTLQLIDALETPYAIVVVPLLIETGFAELVERILVVDCPESQQLDRLRKRDDVSDAEARAMLAAQLDRQTRLARADDVIDNSGSLEATQAQVIALHERYVQQRLPN